MRLFGSLVVQNEGDVIVDLLEFLNEKKIFEKIFFFDLGSDDDTFDKALEFKDLLHEPQVLEKDYSNPLRMQLLLKNRHLYRSGDWLAILDADEFYAEDPREILNLASRESADSVYTYQAEFFLTREEARLFDTEDCSEPIYERRKHYLTYWSELRFFRYMPERNYMPIGSEQPSVHRILNRHYPYRTPEQIEMRVQTRLENRARTKELEGREPWEHIFASDWERYLIPAKVLHQDEGGELSFGLPLGVSAADYNFGHPIAGRMAPLAEELMHTREADLKARFSATVEEEARAQELSAASNPPRLVALGISKTRCNETFNTQPNGQSAIWIRSENTPPGTVVFFDDHPLDSSVADPDIVTAFVPGNLISRPGEYDIWLVYGGEESERAKFVVEP